MVTNISSAGLGVRHDAEVRIENPSDLRRLDVDMDEFATLGVGLDRTGMPVGPAVSDAEHEIGFEHRGVGVAMAGLQADHTGHQRVIVRNGAPRHQRRDDRNVDRFGEGDQELGRIGVDHAAAGHDQRPIRGVEHVERLLDLLARRHRLVDRQRRIGLVVELDLGQLHIERKIDQHRSRPPRPHDMEGLAEHARHQRRLAHGDGPFRHRLCDRLDVDGLEIFLVEPRPRRLTGDTEDRNRIRNRRIEAGDHIGSGGARCADANADIACFRPGITFRHMRGAFDVARQNVPDRAVALQRGVKRVDRGAGNAERAGDPLAFENAHCCIHCSHFHLMIPLRYELA
ncbi:hypothetical protein ACVWW1_001316 [Bradyrhizobium sp. JR3.5]